METPVYYQYNIQIMFSAHGELNKTKCSNMPLFLLPIFIPFHVMSQSRFLTALSIQTTKTTLYLLQKIGNDINILSV